MSEAISIEKTGRKKLIYDFFQDFSKTYDPYQKRRKYYFNHIAQNINFYINPSDSVIEIGCATGNLIGNIKADKRVGIDFSENMIQIAQGKFSDVQFIHQDAEALNLNEKFDVIILSNFLSFSTDILKLLRQLNTLCHEKTKIIIQDYNYLWEPLAKIGSLLGIKKKSTDVNWLSHTDISNFLYLCDFEAYRLERKMMFPFRVPLISFLFNQVLSNVPFLNHLGINQYIFAKPVSKIQNQVSDDKYSCSIVIPARNEAGNIENALLWMPRFCKNMEILFIEGNSTDNTWETIQEIKEKYKNTWNIIIDKQPGKGKIDAVKKGFSLATGDVLMILDADLTVHPTELAKFYNALVQGKGDFINGSRMIYPMEKQAMRLLNTFGNKFFSYAFSWLLNQNIKDTLCGTKVFFREDYKKMQKSAEYFGDFDPFGDFEMIFGAYKANLKIVDLPILYRDRTYGTTNISRFKHGLILLKMVFFAARKLKFRV